MNAAWGGNSDEKELSMCISADESVLGEDGKIDPDKLRPIIFDSIHNTYRVLGEKVGSAFRDGATLK